ncbi:hypothetical protein BCV70DRAFT_199620 [Testicularia cyperi]|uniref:Cation efflux protein transmembrane domain-containing protein n=1 Tax=Testicularia cyperi TaxID=1882483 RepID=A0A317XSP9_9BASI|nr:hypothetical protein BCV70DRAFT_199620 [Testicularia cyperi]
MPSTTEPIPQTQPPMPSQDELIGQRHPFPSSIRFDHTSNVRPRRDSQQDDLDDTFDSEEQPHFASSYTDDGGDRHSSSFGFGFGGHSHSKAIMSSRHGHGFPDRADSVRNISALANLVDYRSNYYEDSRVSDEEIKQRTSHLGWSKASAVCEYYERLNETLDGWREVDEILDSRFPDEVMRRFADQDGASHDHHGKKSKSHNHPRRSRNGAKIKKKHRASQQQPAEESDGNVSDEEETEAEEQRGRQRPLKRSFSAKAMDAFSGLWFGGNSAGNRSDLERGSYSPINKQQRHFPAANGANGANGTSKPRNTFDLEFATEEEDEEDEEEGEADSGKRKNKVYSTSPGAIVNGSGFHSHQRNYGATSMSSAGQLYDKLRREGRAEQLRRSESNLTLSATGTPSGTQSPRGDGTSTPESKAHTIRARQIENIPEHLAAAASSSKAAGAADADQPSYDTEDAQHQAVKANANGNAKIVEVSKGSGSLDRSYSRERRSRPYASQEEERQALLSTVPSHAKEEETSRSVQFAININLLINILLLAGKGVAVLSSNSVSLIASLVDSALDLLSTIIIFATSKAIAYRSWRTIYKYPVGKKRLEPLGVVIFSVLMIASFVQVLIESIGRLRFVLSTGNEDPEASAELPLIGVAFMLATIGIKTVMWLLYRSSKSSGVRAVAQDAENDVVFNIASLIFPVVGSKLGWPALDPIGGILLSIYIIYEWIETLWETVSKLSGAVATPIDISKCLYCIVRFNSVRSVSAFELFHSGDNLIVEADIVLPHSISLKESHDLGEIITYCTENIAEVERSYIHLDYNPKGQAGHLGQRG